MSPRRTRPPENGLQPELTRAYEMMGQITSRLMLVNEAVEAALSSHERAEVSERFLVVADGFSVGAVYGLSDDEHALLVSSQPDIDACTEAVESGRALVVDGDLVTEDALEAVERGLYGEPGPEDLPEEEGAGEAGAEGEGAGAEGGPAEGTATPEAAEAQAGEEAGEGEGAEEGEEGGGTFFGVYVPGRLEDEPVAVLGLGAR